MAGHVSGRVEVRPSRVGMVFEPSLQRIRHATQLVCSAWGGAYFPWIDPSDPVSAVTISEALSLDSLVAVDENAESEALARRPGFFWRGMAGEAFGPPMDVFAARLQGPEWLMDERRTDLVLPRWDPCDPLSDLFAVWFGGYGDSKYERELAERFADVATGHNLDLEAPLPRVSEWVTPVKLTASRIEYTGSTSVGFVLVDPGNAADLVLFWNVRAQGNVAFPWPANHEGRLLDAARAWLTQALEPNKVAHVRSGAGEDLGPHLVVWTNGESVAVPDSLREFCDAGTTTIEAPDTMLPWGWTGSHPLRTGFSRTFSIALSDVVDGFNVPVPRNDPGWESKPSRAVGVVAAHITVFSEFGLPTGWTVAVPRIRELSEVLDRQSGPSWPPFQRPTGDGRVIGVRADADEITVHPVTASQLFSQLVADAGWTVGQSDNGRFASRLIDLLGGIRSQAGNQPALRAVLDQAARTPTGHPLARLIQTAREHQGLWPPESFVPADARAAYPKQVVYYLLQQKLIRALLPVKCPACALTMFLPPEDLVAEIRCEMCSNAVPLGLALALAGKRTDWVYRLAGSVREDRLRETLPLMAALSAFSGWTGFTTPSTVPHALGLDVRTGAGSSEVDLAVVLDDRGRPVIIVGEAKSWRDEVDRNDLENLVHIQDHFRGKGIECLLLAATLRDELTPTERAALRAVCDAAPRTLERHHLNPALPIVLTGRDLSLPMEDKGHPTKWGDWRPDAPSLAIESCKRNLGLKSVTWKWDAAEPQLGLDWD
jgi:hypothetical protein